MARRAWCWRVRSAFTQEVKVIEARKINIHAAFVKITSGQLPFLGCIVAACSPEYFMPHLRRVTNTGGGQLLLNELGKGGVQRGGRMHRIGEHIGDTGVGRD